MFSAGLAIVTATGRAAGSLPPAETRHLVAMWLGVSLGVGGSALRLGTVGLLAALTTRLLGVVVISALSGGRFGWITVGSLCIVARKGRLYIIPLQSIALARSAYYTATWPGPAFAPTTRQFPAMYMASLLVGPTLLVLTLGPVCWMLGTLSIDSEYALSAALIIAVTVAFGLMLTLQMLTDAFQGIRQLYDKRRRELTRALLKVASISNDGKSPRALPDDCVATLSACSQDPTLGRVNRLACHVILFEHFFDLGARQAASSHLAAGAEIWDDLSTFFRRMVTTSGRFEFFDLAAVYTSLELADAAGGRHWLERADDQCVSLRATRLCAEAATLLASGQPEDAHSRAARGAELLNQHAHFSQPPLVHRYLTRIRDASSPDRLGNADSTTSSVSATPPARAG